MPEITPVLYCRRCGQPLEIREVTLLVKEPGGALRRKVRQALMKEPLCEFHQSQRAFYANQGRLEDWEKGLP